MIAMLLVALFATVAVASAMTIVDAAVRGKNAFAALRSEAASGYGARRVSVTTDYVRLVQACRPVLVSSARSVRRPACPAPLRAAA